MSERAKSGSTWMHWSLRTRVASILALALSGCSLVVSGMTSPETTSGDDTTGPQSTSSTSTSSSSGAMRYSENDDAGTSGGNTSSTSSSSGGTVDAGLMCGPLPLGRACLDDNGCKDNTGACHAECAAQAGNSANGICAPRCTGSTFSSCKDQPCCVGKKCVGTVVKLCQRCGLSGELEDNLGGGCCVGTANPDTARCP